MRDLAVASEVGLSSGGILALLSLESSLTPPPFLDCPLVRIVPSLLCLSGDRDRGYLDTCARVSLAAEGSGAPAHCTAAVSAVMLLGTVGVPISWKKWVWGTSWYGLVGTSMLWLVAAFLPYKKVYKSCQICGESEETVWVVLPMSVPLGSFSVRVPYYVGDRKRDPNLENYSCDSGVAVDRRELEKAIGLLVWLCEGAFWLRPWLSCFYKILYKPRVVTGGF